MIDKKEGAVDASKQKKTAPKGRKIKTNLVGNVIHSSVFLNKKQVLPFLFVPLRDFDNGIIDFVRKQSKVFVKSESRVWRFLALYAGSNGVCFPKQDTIAKGIGYSERQVRRAVDALVEKGFLLKVTSCEHRSYAYYFLFHRLFIEYHPSDASRPYRKSQSSRTKCPVKADKMSGKEGHSVWFERTQCPTIPINTKDITQQLQPSEDEGDLTDKVAAMIDLVASHKANPDRWAKKVKFNFRHKRGNLTSLQTEYELFQSKNAASSVHSNYSEVIERCISKKGLAEFEAFVKDAKWADDGVRLELPLMRELIPISFIEEYLAKRSNH
ncbi:helix-turn-helix domain-containing protein [Maridesulfovibrio sp.]|uniref:helix-turn-helix domain-containing protein n=1 Tax=Maridesulfovibrio sp. TaxID=2795000 RepID=UPI003B00C0F6